MDSNDIFSKEGAGFEGISSISGIRRHTPKFLVIIVGIVIIAILGLTAGQMFGKGTGSKPEVVSVIPSSVPTLKEIPVSSPSADLSASPSVRLSPGKIAATISPEKKQTLTVTVLNGSGIKGAAAKMGEILTQSGYTLSGTGNADNFSYKNINISIKKSKESHLAKLQKELSQKGYQVATASADLPEADKADAVIILGSIE